MFSFKTVTLSTICAAALALPSAAMAGEPAAIDASTDTAMSAAAPAAEAQTIDAVEALVEDATIEVSAPIDVVDTAIAAEGFSTLVAAVQAADLVETLKSEGPFTVFAPSDDAFAALPEGTLDDLLKPENKDKLAAILTYHVLPGTVMSTDLEGDMSVPSVQGEEIAVVVSDTGVTVNGANVTAADIVASNGVIHVIDAVILPAEAGKSR